MDPDPGGELRALRERLSGLERAVGRLAARRNFRAPRRVFRVFAQASLPSAAGAFYACRPVDVAGPPAEGGTAGLSEGAAVVMVRILGTPAAGDYVVGKAVGYRWEAEWFAGSSVPTVAVPGCPCDRMPVTLYQSVSDPGANNGILQTCTYAYGPTPPAFSGLDLGPDSYLSTAGFIDQFSGDTFYYYFTCLQGLFAVTRVYVTSVYGSPYRDTTRYQWLVGYPGNACSPFVLSNGQIFPGGDPSTAVTVGQSAAPP